MLAIIGFVCVCLVRLSATDGATLMGEAASSGAGSPLAPASSGTSGNQMMPAQQQPSKLPKINIYISRNEIWKLLGKFI